MDEKVEFPENGWEDIRKTSAALDFGMSHIVAYFVTRSVNDGKVASDLKLINKSAENLFICGHIQNVQCTEVDELIYIKCKCLPEMRKDRVYLLKLAIKLEDMEIVHAECGCPAGKGPRGSCKHIAALAYALIDFNRNKSLPEYRTCTDVLQQWNRPRPRHVEIITVHKLGSHRRELTASSRKSGVVFDPQPTSFRDLDVSKRLEGLRCDLLHLNQPSALLNILIPFVPNIHHDHSYCSRANSVTSVHINTNNSNNCNNTDDVMFTELMAKKTTSEEVLECLYLTLDDREQLERDTRSQSVCAQWFEARHVHITGSKCGRIIIQKEKTVALLRFCLYPKPMIYLPKPIAWGRDNEPNARSKYMEHMKSIGHAGLTTSDSGFIVHMEKSWLGASPDAWVIDPSVLDSKGIAEFKCPYREAGMLLEDACKEPEFCCTMVDGNLCLKRNHTYYHQVQLQLYVASDCSHWCDFCVYTVKDVGVE